MKDRFELMLGLWLNDTHFILGKMRSGGFVLKTSEKRLRCTAKHPLSLPFEALIVF